MFRVNSSCSRFYFSARVVVIGSILLIGANAQGGGSSRAVHPGDAYAYQIGQLSGISAEKKDSRYVFSGRNGFRIMLKPETGDAWDMQAVSVFGLMFSNTGESELVIDVMLRNDGATGWSNSSLGRTIVKPGETMPLGVSLCRSGDYAGTDPAYLRMSGKPDGTFRHWHTIDPKRVKQVLITCASKGEHCFELGAMGALQTMKPERMGVFPFIDAFGQYMLKDWAGKVTAEADLKLLSKKENNLHTQLGESKGFSIYGGWMDGPKLEATGFFRTEQYKDRWWFVDPEGYLFWSHGVTCVGVEFAGQTPTERNPAVFAGLPAKEDPDFGRFHTELDVEDNYKLREDVPHYDFTRANLYKKYGESWEADYPAQELRRMKSCRLNTIGAWSDNEVVAARGVPYTVMLHYEYAFAAEKLPDPFDLKTREGLRKAIQAYPVDFRDDPWCLGAFVNNELHWKNDSATLVKAILESEFENSAVRRFFRDTLKKKYGRIDALNKAWKTTFTAWDDLLRKVADDRLKSMDAADCAELTTRMADAFYRMVKEELHAHAPNVLYLGSRCNSGSPEVMRAMADHVDVISYNLYSFQPHLGFAGETERPVLISEFHYANVGGNNLGSGLRSAQDAVQQGRLYRSFVLEAVNHPQIIGTHWFQWRDQNAAGRYDGENYHVGFFDVVDGPNVELIRAAAEVGNQLYDFIK